MGSPNTNDFFQIGKLNVTAEGAPKIAASMAQNSLGSNTPAGNSTILGWNYIMEDPYGMVQTVPATVGIVPIAYSAFKILTAGIYDAEMFIQASSSAASGPVRLAIVYTMSPSGISISAGNGVEVATGVVAVNNAFLVTGAVRAQKVFFPKNAWVYFFLTNNTAGTSAVDQTLPVTSQASIELVRECAFPSYKP